MVPLHLTTHSCICVAQVLQVIRKTSVAAKYKAAAANLKPRKIENKWSPALKQNLMKIVDASNSQKVLAMLLPLLFFFRVLPWLLIHSRAQAASDKRIAELKAMLNEINGRRGGREMTIDEVLMLQPAPLNLTACSARCSCHLSRSPDLFALCQAMAAFPEAAKKVNRDIADNKWFS